MKRNKRKIDDRDCVRIVCGVAWCRMMLRGAEWSCVELRGAAW